MTAAPRRGRTKKHRPGDRHGDDQSEDGDQLGEAIGIQAARDDRPVKPRELRNEGALRWLEAGKRRQGGVLRVIGKEGDRKNVADAFQVEPGKGRGGCCLRPPRLRPL